MELKLAKPTDLPQLEIMFSKIVQNMTNQGITIWNEFYPYEEFEIDIKNQNLYLLTENDTIVAVFGLFDTTEGIEYFNWQNKSAKAIYLARLGVNVNHLNQGIASKALKHAIEIAKQKNVEYLRLMVADSNIPALKLYTKNNFNQVEGSFTSFMPSCNCDITEFGFEIKI